MAKAVALDGIPLTFTYRRVRISAEIAGRLAAEQPSWDLVRIRGGGATGPGKLRTRSGRATACLEAACLSENTHAWHALFLLGNSLNHQLAALPLLDTSIA